MPTHPIAETLIENFCHVFPEEIPTGLPLKRDIQHHIDLIPGSILPNKPAYGMNPKDTNEIQRQVAELQEKGLDSRVIESMYRSSSFSTKERRRNENVC